jgi:hypothetical protein
MPRDYDDDRPRRRRYDDDDDDRPRRRDRRPPPPQSSGTGLVLLIVGLAVGLPLLGVAGLVCAGFFFAAAARAPGGGNMNATMAEIDAELAAEEFLDDLEVGDTFGAYQSTSWRYQGGTSQAQFDRTVRANPVLTSPHSATQVGTTSILGTSPNRTATLTYNVVPDAPGFGGGRAVTCTVRVAEQPGGTWKVDGFSVP